MVESVNIYAPELTKFTSATQSSNKADDCLIWVIGDKLVELETFGLGDISVTGLRVVSAAFKNILPLDGAHMLYEEKLCLVIILLKRLHSLMKLELTSCVLEVRFLLVTLSDFYAWHCVVDAAYLFAPL